jgi:hypothetical protein
VWNEKKEKMNEKGKGNKIKSKKKNNSILFYWNDNVNIILIMISNEEIKKIKKIICGNEIIISMYMA